MTDSHRDRRQSDLIKDGVLNILWAAFSILGVVLLDQIWPAQTWFWGLLLGAGVGGSAVIVVALIANYLLGGDSHGA